MRKRDSSESMLLNNQNSNNSKKASPSKSMILNNRYPISIPNQPQQIHDDKQVLMNDKQIDTKLHTIKIAINKHAGWYSAKR